ncbi:hypothetical protein C0J52_18433 [Blattella germanica]|nr:hypothetical protein C0J52_18433 [Blattella germanica]
MNLPSSPRFLVDDGSTRRIDMIAFQDTNKGWIIDPTIRMESHADQPIGVHNEKCSIYNATISYYKNKYQLKDIMVLGLMVGARGTITSQVVQFCRQFNLDKNFIKEIAISTLRDSNLHKRVKIRDSLFESESQINVQSIGDKRQDTRSCRNTKEN